MTKHGSVRHERGAHDVIGRCDRSLKLALGVLIAPLSAGAGAVSAAHPSVQTVRTVTVLEPVVRIVTRSVPVLSMHGPPSPDAARSTLLTEHLCLSEAMSYEARGEGEIGPERGGQSPA
jgi:hypothetical protein